MKSVKKKCSKPKKPKKPTKSKLVKACWKEFSRFIRLRDTDSSGYGFCVTCKDPQKQHWKALQAGHYAQGRSLSILFDEEATNAQCLACNIFKHGALDIYADFMIKKFGHGIIEEMKKRKWSNKTYTLPELEELRAKYKNLADIYERSKK